MGFKKMITEDGPVGLEDIAKNTGVAVSTVSRALRDMPGIHPETRLKVLREAELLGYNSRPRKSEVSPSGTRHILILTVGEETPTRYMAGLSRAALSLNVSLHHHFATREESEELLVPKNLPLCLRHELITGIILVYRWPEKIVEKIHARYPAISILHTYQDTALDVIGIDHAGGMYALVKHLKATGHRQIGFIGLDPRVSWSRSRFAGYLEGLLAMGLRVPLESLVQLDLACLTREISHMADQVTAGLARGVRAWVCADDFIGYEVCSELMRRGIRIPEDVAITGFHRHMHVRHGNMPQLTSTEVDGELMGDNALRQLVHRMEHPREGPRLILMPASFFQGQTTPQPEASSL